MNFKKIFRLRRSKGYYPREIGYYWVKWSYGTNKLTVAPSGMLTESGVWRIAFYYPADDTWQITGDYRLFKDADFLEIKNRRLDLVPWTTLGKIMLVLSFAAFLMSVFLMIYGHKK